MDFYIAESQRAIEKRDWNGESARIDSDIQDFLRDDKEILDIDAKCIYSLDPYGDKALSSDDIKIMRDVCGILKNHKYLSHYKNGEIRE